MEIFPRSQLVAVYSLMVLARTAAYRGYLFVGFSELP